MKTRDRIKQKGLEMFNQEGVRNVTLRDVAAAIEKSYGNATYHFPKKIDLIEELYDEMLKELETLKEKFDPNELMQSFLQAPKWAYDISVKYLFFSVDFVELRRVYPEFYTNVEVQNRLRKKVYLELLKMLQRQAFLRRDLSENDLDYLMELSGSIRTFFFMNTDYTRESHVELKEKFVKSTNLILKPYLTEEGLGYFKSLL